MQQFTVPQFIDVEDKVLGPITARQFVIMLAGFMFMAFAWKFFDFALFLTVAIITVSFIILFGFVKINGRPFHFFVLNFVQTVKRPSLRVWNNTAVYVEEDPIEVHEKVEPIILKRPIEHASSRLAELSLIVDTSGAYKREGKQENILIDR